MQQQTFPHRVGYLQPCVLPASVLSDEILPADEDGVVLPSIREAFSQKGLTYAKVLGIAPTANYQSSENSYWVEVASSPSTAHSGRLSPAVTTL